MSVDGTHDEPLERMVQVFLDAIAACASPEAADIADVSPAIQQVGPKLHTLTVEVELGTKGGVIGAVA